jgi:glycerophosphoryl diester phosphodiesterase
MHRGAAYAAVLEFDLRLTADHQIMLMHDVTLDRTTNCTGRVIDWTLQNLRAQCHVGSQPIPTFDEVAAYAETTTLKIAPEIKNADISDADLGQVFNIIDAHGLQGRTIMQSFEAPVLQRVHALRPDLRLMLVATEPVTVAAARAAYVTTVAIRLENLTAAQVANYKRNSMKVWTFTAIDNPTLDQAHRIHADAVITDIPGLAKAHYGG